MALPVLWRLGGLHIHSACARHHCGSAPCRRGIIGISSLGVVVVVVVVWGCIGGVIICRRRGIIWWILCGQEKDGRGEKQRFRTKHGATVHNIVYFIVKNTPKIHV